MSSICAASSVNVAPAGLDWWSDLHKAPALDVMAWYDIYLAVSRSVTISRYEKGLTSEWYQRVVPAQCYMYLISNVLKEKMCYLFS